MRRWATVNNFCCILYSVTSCSDTMADTRALHARLLLDYNYTLHAKRLSLLRVLALAFRSAPQSIPVTSHLMAPYTTAKPPTTPVESAAWRRMSGATLE